MKILVAFVLSVIFLLNSCNKDKLSDVQASEDDVFAQTNSSELLALINEYSIQYFHLHDTVLYNPIITIEGDTFPKTMSISFNLETNMENGASYLGTIIVNCSDSINKQGNTIEYSFNDFKINDYKITGNYSLIIDTISQYFTEYSLKANSIKFTFPGAKEFSWNMDQIVLLNRGTIVPENFENDEYLFYGVSSGTALSKRNFSSGIIEPLLFKNSCKSVVEGKKELIPFEFSMRLIDYGDGDCNRNATITSEGEDYIFEF